MKGGDRSSPQSFARWLNDVQFPAMLVREEASRLKIGLLVSQQHRHKVSIPLHGVSTSLSATSTTLPRAASSSSSPSLSPATVLAAIDHVERVTLSEKTAARYMNRLGYTRVGHHKGCKCKCSVCDERITECSCGISEGDVDEEDGGEAEASHEDAVSPSEDDGRTRLTLMKVSMIGLSLRS